MRYAAAIILSLIGTGAYAGPIVCTFNDDEQEIMRDLLEVASGLENRPRGGILNARKANYMASKFAGQMPNAELNCKPVQPPEKPKDEPVK